MRGLSGRIFASRRDDRGAVAIIVVLFILIFMVLLAFVIDFGRQYSAKAQAQNAVDAAALAAAQDLCTTGSDPAQTAVDYAASNGVSVVKADVDVNRTTNTVTVPASAPISTFFGQFAGVSTLGVDVVAQAGNVCGTRRFGLYADETLTFNGSNSDAVYVYAGDTFTPNGTGTDIFFMQTDPGATVNSGANIGTLDSTGNGDSAQQYAAKVPYDADDNASRKIDVWPASGETKFNTTTETSYADLMSNPTSATTDCGSNSNSTRTALNGNQAGRFVCTANAVSTNGLTSGFTGSISSTFPITLGGTGVITFDPQFIYSTATGTAITLSGVVITNPKTIIYAPNGTVNISSSGNLVEATVIARNIVFNGSKQSATGEGSIIPGTGATGSTTLLR